MKKALASFGTFCVQIGQFVEVHRVFEECLNIEKLPFSKKNVADFEFLRIIKDVLRALND